MGTECCSQVWTVTLEPWECEIATYVGKRRTKENEGKANAAHYDERRMMKDNEAANIASVHAEYAFAKAANRYCVGGIWKHRDRRQYRHLPDVRPNYEVRRITRPDNPLVVRAADVEAGRRMVLVYCHPPDWSRCDIIGAIDAVRGWEIGTPADYKPDTVRLVGQEHLEHKWVKP